MDKNTLSEYGWIVIVILLLAFMLASVSILIPIVNKNSNDVIEHYFKDTEVEEIPQLQPPNLSLNGDTLIIVDPTTKAEQYEIYINGVYVDKINRVHPSTSYAIHTEFIETFIEVRSVAEDYLPSEKVWIFHYVEIG